MNFKPCPFCGSPARSDGERNEPENRFVECTSCNADISGPYAYEQWNARCNEAVGRWIATIEKMPNDDQFILAFGKHEMQIMAHYANQEFFAWNHESENWDDPIGHLVTYWMPLPSAPERSK